MAAIPEITTVRIMTFMPKEMPLSAGIIEKILLAIMEIATSPAITWFFLHGGIMTARNMP